MKKWNSLFENCRLSIKIIVFGLTLLAIGYIITNQNVNIFYTIKSPFVIELAKIFTRIGHIIIINIPLIFIINLTAKRANSGTPALMGIVGYVVFLVVTMFMAPKDLPSQAYTSVFGISYTDGQNVFYPLQTGLIGSFLVAFITRYSYLKSRRRSIYSILSFLEKDTAGLIYNLVLCGLLGLIISFVWPYGIGIIQDLIDFIAKDINSPIRLIIYGILERILSILGLSQIIRTPFWFGIEGGTYSTIAGQTVIGDVAIWGQMPEALATFSGAGRFITPYYVINIFIIPAIYLAFYFTNSNRQSRIRKTPILIVAMVASIICGNPLPIELLMLFMAPLLLIVHILISGSLFGILAVNHAYLGFEYTGSVVSAMPGSFPDFIINLRMPQYTSAIITITIVGIIMAIIYFIITRLYFEYFAYDIAGTNRSTKLAIKTIDSMGGIANIDNIYATPYDLTIKVKNIEDIIMEDVKNLGPKRITETRDGVRLSFGAASTIIKKRIDKQILKSTR